MAILAHIHDLYTAYVLTVSKAFKRDLTNKIFLSTFITIQNIDI